MEYSLRQQKKIELVNRLTLVVYLLLIFEGALRKWVLPQFSGPLYFIKDPFVLYIYWLCFYYRLFPKNFYFTLSMFLALIFYFLVSLQSLLIPFNTFAGIFGWRTYFYFIPLSFIIAHHFTKEDLIRISKITCLLAVPIAILTFIQYQSSPDSYINKNVGLEVSKAYTLLEDIVRPSGTFSFTIGQATYICSLLAMLMFNFFLPPAERFLKPTIFYICFIAFFVNLAVSGSRGAYVNVFIILLFLLLASLLLINRKQGVNSLLYLTLSCILAVLLFYFVFERELEIIIRRQTLAENEEGSIFLRMLSMFISLDFFVKANPPLLGYGLGLSSGGGSFLATGKRNFTLAETDWARNILEAGMLLGVVYILYRIFLTLHVMNKAIVASKKSYSPVPIIFLGFVVPNLLVGSITGNGTSNVYNWIFVGLSLAFSRVYMEGKKEETQEL